MLTLECPKCGERKDIQPVSPIVSNIRDMEIECVKCKFKGTPKFVITSCIGE